VDSVGNAYVTGVTYSVDFPNPNPFQPNFGAVFVAKLNAGGSALAYSFGWASTFDKGSAIAVDASGSAYVTGHAGGGFQTVNALQPTFGGTGPFGYGDAFVAKLNPAGTAFVYWTYLGGSRDDEGNSITVDADGNAYITGSTASADFPTVNALQSSFGGGPLYDPFDVFIAKLNPTGSTLVYSTYLGGSGEERAGRLAVDAAGNAYVTGFTNSFDFPLANALQPTLSCSLAGDAFVVKLNPTASALVYSTYLGGTDGPRTLEFSYVANNIQSPDLTANFAITLKPEQQLIIPNLIQYLRDHGISDIGPVGPIYAGGLFATVEADDASGIFLGANTSTPGGGGRYGSFYVAVPSCPASYASAWVYGLQQNSENRTNLALLNTGQADGNPNVFNIELYDGTTGLKIKTVEGITLNAKRWLQVEAILAHARVTRTAGSNPFIAYAVINDGEHPGERTGDGSFVSSQP
jgi:hypothetical protein